MIQNKKRIISLILMLTLLVSALVVGAVTASAAEKTVSVKIADQGWSNEVKNTTLTLDNNITVTVEGGTNSGKYYTNGNEWRIYQSESPSITVQAADGVTITSVKFTYNISKNGVLTFNGDNKASGEVISINAASATFGVGNTGSATNGQVRITAIEVVYNTISTEPEVPAPEIGNEATISFANTTHRVSQDTQSQVWANGGLTLTNNKAGSTNSIIDSSNPVRLYKNSTITIEFSGMTKIEFVCSSGSYATDLASSITDKTVNCVKNGTNVTLTFSEAMDKYTITLSAGQVRLYTITASAVEITCKHNNVTTTTVEATCTKDGSTTETCKDCGEIVSTKVIEKLGHSYNDGEITTEPTCTEQGEKTYTCSVCNNKKTEAVVSNGHKYADGVCSVCGEKEINYSGRYVIAVNRGANANYFYMTSDLGTASTSRYQAVDSGLTELTATICPKDGFIFVLVKNGDGTYKIYAEGVEGDNYLGWTSGNSGTLVNAESAKSFSVVKLDDGTYNISFDGRYLSLNGTSGNNYFAYYTGTQKQNLSLIPVSDHVYADATCTAPKTCSVCSATEGEALGHNHENCPHKAVVGETYYETLQQAIAGAAAGSEIVLNSDIEVVGELPIEKKVTINLNGKTLTAGAVVTFYEGTKFIGEGKLEVAKNSLYNIKGETDYVPVWNEAGYYTFSEVKDQIKESTVEDTEVVVFRPAFKNTEIKKEFADGATDNGISFVVSITWEGLEKPKEYTLSNTLIAEIYSQKKAIQLGFENWQAGVEYTVTLRIVSGGLYYETDLCTMKDGAITVPEIVTE